MRACSPSSWPAPPTATSTPPPRSSSQGPGPGRAARHGAEPRHPGRLHRPRRPAPHPPRKAAAGLAQLGVDVTGKTLADLFATPLPAGHTFGQGIPLFPQNRNKNSLTSRSTTASRNSASTICLYSSRHPMPPTDEPSPLKSLDEIVEDVGLYPREAYKFVQAGLALHRREYPRRARRRPRAPTTTSPASSSAKASANSP